MLATLSKNWIQSISDPIFKDACGFDLKINDFRKRDNLLKKKSENEKKNKFEKKSENKKNVKKMMKSKITTKRKNKDKKKNQHQYNQSTMWTKSRTFLLIQKI